MEGKVILGYTIDEKIGSGGFGTVYRVSKSNIAGTEIRALKHICIPSRKQYMDVLNSMGGDRQKADSYFVDILNGVINEIQIIRSMSSSGVNNIVTYYENDIITHEQPRTYDVFILMEYLKPLPNFLYENAIKVSDVVQIAIDILTALIACHEHHIIHRDIKEDNIFVSANGVYKLGDFGISRVLNNRSGAASMKGTPNYIAPEVYLGREKYDHTVDIYSLGIVLYRLLNGARGPFLPNYPQQYTGADEDVAFEKRMRGQIPSLPCFANNMLGEVIVQSLMPRGTRFHSARAFLDAIVNAANNLSVVELGIHLGQSQVQSRHINTPGSFPIQPSNTFDAFAPSIPEVSTPRRAEPNLFQSISDSYQDPRGNQQEERSQPQHIERSSPYYEGSAAKRQIEPDQRPQFSVRKYYKDNKLMIYLVPAIILILYLAMYMILIPIITDKGISIIEWLFNNAEEIVSTIQSHRVLDVLSDVELPRIPFGIIYLIKILNWVLLVALFISLYYVGRTLHFKAPEISEAAELKGNEAYIKTMEIYETMRRSASPVTQRARDAVYALLERLKNGSAFGSGSVQVILCENEIAACLVEIERNVQGLFNEGTEKIASSNIEIQCEKIRSKLRLRIELKKKSQKG